MTNQEIHNLLTTSGYTHITAGIYSKDVELQTIHAQHQHGRILLSSCSGRVMHYVTVATSEEIAEFEAVLAETATFARNITSAVAPPCS